MTSPDFDLSYTQLPNTMFAIAKPDVSPRPEFVWLNDDFANEIEISHEWLEASDALDLFSGRTLPTDYEPVAMAYSGFQFGQFSPKLGDGRAVLIGEHKGKNTPRYDIHLKGSGATQYSRRGDGKSTLRAALKECIFSECLAGLNISTTRSLAVLTTGETVMRQEEHQGAILVRAAKSLIRVGTFQFAGLLEDKGVVKKLADFLIAREYPEVDADDPNAYQVLFASIVSRQAELIAQWMSVGFIHGVMNTDNMALSGETIDFGPCAFMERFKADQVYSSIDHYGRYAWNKQAEIAVWNLTRLAETFLPILDENIDTAITKAEAEINTFSSQFLEHFSWEMMRKMGLSLKGEVASQFMSQTFAMLHAARPDFTLFFRRLGGVARDGDIDCVLNLCEDPKPLQIWLPIWQSFMEREAREAKEIAKDMDAVNPAYIPRLHLVENAIDAANKNDYSKLHCLLKALHSPYHEMLEFADFQSLPVSSQSVAQTFCET